MFDTPEECIEALEKWVYPAMKRARNVNEGGIKLHTILEKLPNEQT